MHAPKRWTTLLLTWAIAGSASATYLKQMSGQMDLHLEIMVEPEVEDYKGLRIPVKLANGGDTALFDIEVSLLDTQSLEREEITSARLNMIAPGEEVVIVEDVVTTGGSSLTAIERVEQFGLKVARLIAIIDRMEGGTEAFAAKCYRLSSLLCIRDFGIEPPKE